MWRIKQAERKWINENKIDFLKKVFPNRWNDIQDNEAKQRYVTKMEADKMRVAELDETIIGGGRKELTG